MSISSSDGEAPLPMVVRKSSHPPADKYPKFTSLGNYIPHKEGSPLWEEQKREQRRLDRAAADKAAAAAAERDELEPQPVPQSPRPRHLGGRKKHKKKHKKKRTTRHRRRTKRRRRTRRRRRRMRGGAKTNRISFWDGFSDSDDDAEEQLPVAQPIVPEGEEEAPDPCQEGPAVSLYRCRRCENGDDERGPHDQVSLTPIPAGNGICADRHCYNRDSLVAWNQRRAHLNLPPQIPHSNRVYDGNLPTAAAPDGEACGGPAAAFPHRHGPGRARPCPQYPCTIMGGKKRKRRRKKTRRHKKRKRRRTRRRR